MLACFDLHNFGPGTIGATKKVITYCVCTGSNSRQDSAVWLFGAGVLEVLLNTCDVAPSRSPSGPAAGLD